MTTKINLLPPEIIEQRKSEKIVVYVLICISVLAVVLVGVYFFNNWRIRQAESNLAQINEEVQKMSAMIGELQKYEQIKTELDRRQQTVQKAVAGNVLWSKILNELSMITPNDVTLTQIAGDATGLTMTGYAIDQTTDNPDFGHKAVARWLVHLAEMQLLPSIWLGGATKSGDQIQFTTTAKFVSQSTVPAPPPPPPPPAAGK